MTASNASKKTAAAAVSDVPLLVIMFVGWYVASYYTDTLNKKIQAKLAVPMTLTLLQFLSGGLCSGLILRGLKISPFMPLRLTQLRSIIPVAACWTIGFLTTNMSLGSTAVSFTHAVKATEPLFLVVIATLFFGKRFAPSIWVSLLPIAAGIVLVAVSDVSFTMLGFLMAAVSNCCFTSRSLLVKDVLSLGLVDNLNLFYYISWLSFAVVFVPVCIFELPLIIVEWRSVTYDLAAMALANGILHYVYNQLSMLILGRVAALTHSIGNASRRFVIIMVSILAGQSITPQTMMGIGCLAVGVSGYIYARASSGDGAPASTVSASTVSRTEQKEERKAKAVGPRIMGRSTEAMRRSPSPTKPASISTFHTY